MENYEEFVKKIDAASNNLQLINVNGAKFIGTVTDGEKGAQKVTNAAAYEDTNTAPKLWCQAFVQNKLTSFKGSAATSIVTMNLDDDMVQEVTISVARTKQTYKSTYGNIVASKL